MILLHGNHPIADLFGEEEEDAKMWFDSSSSSAHNPGQPSKPSSIYTPVAEEHPKIQIEILDEGEYTDDPLYNVEGVNETYVVHINTSIVDNQLTLDDVDNDISYTEEKKNALLNITIKPISYSVYWIRRGRQKNYLIPIWYFILGTESDDTKTYKGYYVHAIYNRSQKSVHIYGRPCGHVPSVSCAGAMVKDLSHVSRPDRCSKRVPVPILYNIPRWSIRMALPDATVQTESFTLTSVVISTIITHYGMKLNRSCAGPLHALYAVHRNFIRLRLTQDSIYKFINTIPGLLNSTDGTTQFTQMTKFYEFSTSLYASICSSASCSTKAAYDRNIAEGNRAVDTGFGTVNISSLVLQDMVHISSPPPTPRTHKLLDDLTHLDNMLLDYLDTLALVGPLNNSHTIDVPIGPHTRRKGSIPLRGV